MKRLALALLPAVLLACSALTFMLSNTARPAYGDVWCWCLQYVQNLLGLPHMVNCADQAGVELAAVGYVQVADPQVGAAVIFQRGFPGVDPDCGHIGMIRQVESVNGGSDWHLLVRSAAFGGTPFSDAGCTNVSDVWKAPYAKTDTRVTYWAKPATPTPTPPPTPPSCANTSCFQQWLFRNGTGLGEAGSNWVFKLADFDHDGRADLAGVLMSQTGSGRTEVHVLSAASNYQQFIVHAATELGETDANQYQFDFADWDHDGAPDLVAILMNQTGSHTTEIHIDSGASGFIQRIYDSGTALGESTASQWKFAVQDWNGDGVPDLIGVLMNQTGSGFTEVHILSGASNFQQWLAQDVTPLGETDAADWDFVLADIDRDGIPDLLGILTQNTSTFSTEIHAMSGSSHYHQWLMRTGTPLGKTDLNQFAFAAGDWNGDRAPDLFAILKYHTGTHTTELHVLSGVPSRPPPDSDGDGIIDDLDNCPNVANAGQENTDSGPPPSGTGAIGNGTGIPGNDATIPNGDSLGDACDPDNDNDGIPNASDSDPGGDITYDDNTNGNPCVPLGSDAADDGPSWDANCNGIRDGVEGSCPLAVNPNGDDDGDGLLNTWEICKWGTDPTKVDTDGDGKGDCVEAVDTDGNGIVDFGGDALNSARATLLPAGVGAGKFGKDGDFDLNGNSVLAGDFGNDTLTVARFALKLLPCQ